MQNGTRLAYRIVVAQLVIALATVLGLSVFAPVQALAAGLSSVACIVPTAGFAVCASRSRNPVALVMAGVLKPLAIIGCLVAAFIVAQPAPLGFFVGLVAVHFAYFAAPLLERFPTRRAGSNSVNIGSECE